MIAAAGNVDACRVHTNRLARSVGPGPMELKGFVEKYVMTDPEWRHAYKDADATREAARALVRPP